MTSMTIKALHVGCVVLSVSLFVLRAIPQWLDMPWRRWAILRITPHLIDTVLLGSALGLVFATR